MTTLMGDDGFQRKVFRIGVALERLRRYDEQVLFQGRPQAKLGAARLSVNVTVLDAPNEAESASNPSGPSLTGAAL